MEAIRINLKDDQGIQRTGEVVRLGIPLGKGSLTPDTPMSLSTSDEHKELFFQSSPMAHWPDGSVRWLKLQFIVDLHPNQILTLELRDQEPAPLPTTGLTFDKSPDGITVKTGATEFRLHEKTPTWNHDQGDKSVSHHLTLINRQDELCRPEADHDWQIIEHGSISLSCKLEGWFFNDKDRLARFHCQLTFFLNSQTVEVQTCLHNPNRASHPGGLWDLGDSGSIHFKALKLIASISDIDRIHLTPELGQPAVEIDEGKSCLLYQDSSGGEHWDGLNHVNAKGEITTRFKGYRLSVGNQGQLSGNRAAPTITVSANKKTVQASLPRFWQNFPSSLGVENNQLFIGLFPTDAAEPYELQGGERKTQTAYFHYGDTQDALSWTLSPIVPTLNASQYEVSQAFPWFRAEAPLDPLGRLIRQGLDGPSNFFAKREVIDEYGWRHFGDIFADHETLYQPDGEPPLVSHYNNQYDAIYGFARQFALSGDSRWHELMDDLAAHVRDIDIYHTDEDRSEYNHGLFWHTDHYLPAHTATHRTFTRHNDTSSTPGQTGGGPASEHCYTTGLMYHYYLSGHEHSRSAALDLAHWIRRLHEGQGGLLEQILALKKNEWPLVRALLKGEKPPPHRYPFTRGTGNYLNAMLDAHLLEPEQDWLIHAESIIAATIHPSDDIASRDLLNVETGWSYLVLLSSIARYIDIKREQNQTDTAYQYAVSSFLHYAKWMAANERPFLEDTEQLEFANDTWVAQDIRKAMLMFQAAQLQLGIEQFRQQGSQWLDKVCRTLENSNERHFSRILIILMQNYGPHSYSSGRQGIQVVETKTEPRPRLTWIHLMARILARAARGIITFRPGREREWLAARIERT